MLLFWTFVIATAAEAAGLSWWMTEMRAGRSLSAYIGLAAGEAVELAMVVYYLRQAPSKGGGRRLWAAVGVMALIALFEVIVWAAWYETWRAFGPAAAAGVLFVLMHLKHDADVANISNTKFGLARLTAKGLAATGLETLGAVVAVGFVGSDRPVLAALALAAFLGLEHFFGRAIIEETLAGRDFLTPNPMRSEGRQHSLTVASYVKPCRIDRLRALLRQFGSNVGATPSLPLERLSGMHFCSWFTVTTCDHRQVLIFEANFDGPIETFLDALVSTLSPGLAEIYRECEGLSGAPTAEELRAHLIAHRVFTNAFYIGAHGLTVQQILRDESLRNEIEAFIDNRQAAGDFATPTLFAEVRSAIQQRIRSLSQYDWAQEQAAIPWNLRNGPRVVRITVVALAALLLFGLYSRVTIPSNHGAPPWALLADAVVGLALLVAAIFGLRLLWKEWRDVEPDFTRLRQPRIEVLVRENQQAINHLANVSPLKPGLTRWWTIRGVLSIVHWGSLLLFNRGMLAGTATIHFARWTIINDGRDLLFLSNYDGSWDRYLSDFVDRSSAGLTAIWSNTQEFPRSWGLVGGGAAKEEPFKAAARRRQVESLLWYSAYPQLTMTNIQNNQALRVGLFAELDDAETKAWLRRL